MGDNMNKRGFTLIELIAVLVLVVLVMLLIVPNLSNLRNQNRNKEFKTYEDMMVEYTKTIPNYKTKGYVCLNDLQMQKINETMDCNGYVKIENNKLTPFLSCLKSGKNVYKTEGYSLPSTCS